MKNTKYCWKNHIYCNYLFCYMYGFYTIRNSRVWGTFRLE